MPKADFTYEVRKLPMDPDGIEDYVVRARDGEPVGTVAVVLERDRGERLLVIEGGVPPLMSFSALVAALAVSLAGDNTFLFLVPAALAVAMAVVCYRAYRRPYEPRGARKP